MISRIVMLGLVVSSSLFGAIKVVTSTTDLAWVAQQIGKERVEVTSLLKGTENPHYTDTVPEYIRQVADAQVVCIVGLELEVGWIPKVLSKSGNAGVQPGGKGYCETGKRVSVIDKPTGEIDRSMGDVHPAGNPHFWLSPRHLAEASQEVTAALIRVDPAGTAAYQKNAKAFTERMEKLVAKGKKRLSPLVANLKVPAVIEYHKEFAYFLTLYDIPSFGSLEEKPGVPPSAGRIAETALAAKQAGVKMMLAAEFSPKKTVERFRELSGIDVVKASTSVLYQNGKLDYEAWQDSLVEAVAQRLKPEPKAE